MNQFGQIILHIIVFDSFFTLIHNTLKSFKLSKIIFCIHREIVSNYSKEVRQLGLRLQEVISQSLGLEKGYINSSLGEAGQHMAINYYPPCPEPELTFGLPAHTDPNTLTILLQDTQVSGLQLLNDGQWLSVKPVPNAFVVNIGDQLQVRTIYFTIFHFIFSL